MDVMFHDDKVEGLTNYCLQFFLSDCSTAMPVHRELYGQRETILRWCVYCITNHSCIVIP